MLTINQDEMSVGFPVLSELKDQYGFDQWMIMRMHGTDCVVVAAEGDAYGISKGMMFKLNKAIPEKLPQFKKARVVPNIESERDQLPFVNNHFPIASYLHFPIINKEHQFFGSLFAISAKPQINFTDTQLCELDTINQTISKQLNVALASSKTFRSDSLKQVAGDIDEMTKLFNWRGWERLLDSEEMRCRNFGYVGDIITIDFVGLTDYISAHGGQSAETKLKKIALTLAKTAHEDSIIARVGSSEFVICSINNTAESIEEYADNILNALSFIDIQVLVGSARSIPNKGLRDAWEHAEHALYKQKSHFLLD